VPAAPSDWSASTHTDSADVAQAGAAAGAGVAEAAVVAPAAAPMPRVSAETPAMARRRMRVMLVQRNMFVLSERFGCFPEVTLRSPSVAEIASFDYTLNARVPR